MCGIVVVGLEQSVRNMLVSLKAVSQLQDSSIRDRHWQQLMTMTGVRFTMDEHTTLADLLALELHNFEDQVTEIVDKARKEMGMEKVLTSLAVLNCVSHRAPVDVTFCLFIDLARAGSDVGVDGVRT